MRNKINLLLLALSIFILGLFLTRAWGEEFSADIITTAGATAFYGKIFVGENKIRMENPRGISITRIDRNIIWILMPAQRQYMEQPLKPSDFLIRSNKVEGETERKSVGVWHYKPGYAGTTARGYA